MLRALWVAIYCDPEALIKTLVGAVAIAGCALFGILRLGVEQKDICPREFGHLIDMLENLNADTAHILFDD